MVLVYFISWFIGCFLIFLFDSWHVKQIVPPVINSFSDQDSRVRYYACEALYNIAKVKILVVSMCFSSFFYVILALMHCCPFFWFATGCARRFHYFLQ